MEVDRGEALALATRALETACGGALVLDESLRVVLATRTAERLLGADDARGEHAVKLLCGESSDRTIAEALAHGRSITTTAPRFHSEEPLLVRAIPLRSRGAIAGWLVELDGERTTSESALVVPPSDPAPANDDESTRIRKALERSGGDRNRAATILGISRTTLWRRMRTLGLLVALAALGCGAGTRFAIRSPVLHDTDDRLFEPAPRKDEEADLANSIDVMLLGPVSRGLAFRTGAEALDVNSLDEVPDSTWFTNRIGLAAEALERGPCPDAGAVLPLAIKSSKVGGTTPGFVVKDARKQSYVMKLDKAASQPEISTAADAIVSRLYWAIGFNAPCNDVVYFAPSQLRLQPTSYETMSTGERVPLGAARLAELSALATRAPSGLLRASTSRYIDGEPIGTWRTEGTRADDPNDRIPHEDRRELRGEYFLAAWTAHWDSRGPNTFDAFVRPPHEKRGYVRHYFIDFSDALGGMSTRTVFPEPRMGFVSVSNVPVVLEDTLTLGVPRRPWDDVRIDPLYPNLGFFGVGHFDPLAFSPQTPLLRWARADRADLAWMARKMARLDVEHVRVAVRAGRLSNPAEEARLVEILMGRRDRILRVSFADVSPLADVTIEGARICATDLGTATKLDRPESVVYRPRAERDGDRVCFDVPRGGGYGTADLARKSSGKQTVLRVHFYDRDGYGEGEGDRARKRVLAGIERL